jgi:hypothetical protein
LNSFANPNARDATATISAGATEDSLPWQDNSHYTPVSSQALTLCKIVIALAIVGAIGFLVARKPRDRKVTPAPNNPPAATIKAATAHLGDIGYYIDALGTVTPVATLNVYSYRTGVDTYLNAQTSLLTNQQTAVSLRIEQMTSSVQLIEAFGGGWDTTQLPS